MKIEKIAEVLIQNIQAGGATVNQGGREITEGIAVGVHPEYEHTCNTGTGDHLRGLLRKEVIAWLKVIDIEPGACIGLWAPGDGRIVLDVTRVLSTRRFKEAVKLALENKQEAIQLLNPCVTLSLTEC